MKKISIFLFLLVPNVVIGMGRGGDIQARRDVYGSPIDASAAWRREDYGSLAAVRAGAVKSGASGPTAARLMPRGTRKAVSAPEGNLDAHSSMPNPVLAPAAAESPYGALPVCDDDAKGKPRADKRRVRVVSPGRDGGSSRRNGERGFKPEFLRLMRRQNQIFEAMGGTLEAQNGVLVALSDRLDRSDQTGSDVVCALLMAEMIRANNGSKGGAADQVKSAWQREAGTRGVEEVLSGLVAKYIARQNGEGASSIRRTSAGAAPASHGMCATGGGEANSRGGKTTAGLF